MYRIIAVMSLLIFWSFTALGQDKDVDVITDIIQSLYPKTEFIESLNAHEPNTETIDSSELEMANRISEMLYDDYDYFVNGLVEICIKHFTAEELEEVKLIGETKLSEIIEDNYIDEFSSDFENVLEAWYNKVLNIVLPPADELEIQKFNAKTNLDCSSFRYGEFYYYTFDSLEVKVERYDSIQKETVGLTELELKIEWLEDCRYTLRKIKQNGQDEDDLLVEVNIVSMSGDTIHYIGKSLDDRYSPGFLIKDLRKKDKIGKDK